MEKSKFLDLTAKYANETEPFAELINLKGQVAVVTGGAGTLGYLISRRLLEAGASVVLTDINEERGAYAEESLISLCGKNVIFKKGDITKTEDMDAVMNFAVEKYGRLDICVHSAAYWSYYPTLGISDEEWNYTIDTVLTGTMIACRSAAKVMKELGNGGKIVPILSDASINCEPPLGVLDHYAAAKAGARGFARSFAREVKQYGINVNMMLAGAMNTIGARFLNVKGMENPETRAKMAHTNMPMSNTPDDMARVVFMLCTKISDFMYGADVIVDGGAHINLGKE
ncbi:SDR family NAD(P)-dependent oxidoreductase [Alkalibacter mobilis]|uniref:SDR family NAD(P)-dependent oxidoreductase n=1 Tax=Alkalibacter mobilis TaxID=2787712 RepID=UPI00189CF7C4|nr:SDR family oxidoreductase [Alkalibacter mobilis]MBF7096833.1 SDR family oxidoreductase [Alkalibacter mobilis]